MPVLVLPTKLLDSSVFLSASLAISLHNVNCTNDLYSYKRALVREIDCYPTSSFGLGNLTGAV